jgi:hypothetical protein
VTGATFSEDLGYEIAAVTMSGPAQVMVGRGLATPAPASTLTFPVTRPTSAYRAMFHRHGIALGIGFLGHPALHAFLAGCLLRPAERARKVPPFRVFTLPSNLRLPL